MHFAMAFVSVVCGLVVCLCNPALGVIILLASSVMVLTGLLVICIGEMGLI